MKSLTIILFDIFYLFSHVQWFSCDSSNNFMYMWQIFKFNFLENEALYEKIVLYIFFLFFS